MSTKQIQLNEALNLIQIKGNMDEIVFNYIDTAQKWDQAYESLNELLNNMIDYFQLYISKNNGEFPKVNTYWTLFLSISSKLIYFHTLAFKHVKQQQDEVKTRFLVAANCIPNVQAIANAEFLNEIANSYEEIELYNGKEGEFERNILKQNNSGADCLKHFQQFADRVKL